MPQPRQTFVLRVHPGGVTTLENVSTREQVRLDELADLPGRVRAWLADAGAASRRSDPPTSGPADRA